MNQCPRWDRLMKKIGRQKSRGTIPLIPKAFEFIKQQSAILLFLLVDVFLRFAQNSFEKWQAAICHISKEFCENLGNVLTNRKKGI
jgi:hypothetical protein